MARPFRFMGRDPVSEHTVDQRPASVHVVEAKDGPAICGASWERAVSEGWVTREELRTAKFRPTLLGCCQDVLWGIRRGPRD